MDTMNIEIVVNIGPIVNAVKSAKSCLVNIVNDVKTINSGHLYCEICVYDKKSFKIVLWFHVL
jgi:hypothetical protein